MNAPVIFQWDGDHMVPMARFAKLCDQTFVVHEYYRMDVINERSWRSHRHYFAALHEAWANLPEECQMESWAQSSEHLRHFALIRVGLFDVTIDQVGSNAEAIRTAALFRPLKRLSIVTAVRSTVVTHTAQSQSVAAMGGPEFQQSKNLVLDFVADLARTTRGQLESAALTSA